MTDGTRQRARLALQVPARQRRRRPAVQPIHTDHGRPPTDQRAVSRLDCSAELLSSSVVGESRVRSFASSYLRQSAYACICVVRRQLTPLLKRACAIERPLRHSKLSVPAVLGSRSRATSVGRSARLYKYRSDGRTDGRTNGRIAVSRAWHISAPPTHTHSTVLITVGRARSTFNSGRSLGVAVTSRERERERERALLRLMADRRHLHQRGARARRDAM